METLRNCLFVGIGGALGTISRYLISLLPVKPQNGFPVVTLCINIIGAFFIGLIVALATKNKHFDPGLLLFLKVGICGGFTTFSTFSLETVGLLRAGNYFAAVSYMALSVILCLAAVISAQVLVK